MAGRACVLAYHRAGAGLDVLAVTPFEPGDGPHRAIAKFAVRDGGDAEVSGLSWFLDDPSVFDEELLAPYPVFDVKEPVTVTLLGDSQGRREFAVAVGGKTLFPDMPFAVQGAGALVLKWAGREFGRGTLSILFNGRGDLDTAAYGEFMGLPALSVGQGYFIQVADWQDQKAEPPT